MNEEVSPLPVNTNENLPSLTDQKMVATGAYVGFNEAVRLSGVSKPTFSKYVEKGRLSPIINEKGKKVYQVVDIQRVFPEGVKATSQKDEEINQSLPESRGGATALKIAQLEGEKAVLQAQLKAEREKATLLEELAHKAERNADDLRQALKMLTYQPPKPEPETQLITPQPEPLPEPKKGFFGRLFGGR